MREPGLEPEIREGGGVRVGRATVARLTEQIGKIRASHAVWPVRRFGVEPGPPYAAVKTPAGRKVAPRFQY